MRPASDHAADDQRPAVAFEHALRAGQGASRLVGGVGVGLDAGRSAVVAGGRLLAFDRLRGRGGFGCGAGLQRVVARDLRVNGIDRGNGRVEGFRGGVVRVGKGLCIRHSRRALNNQVR
jgi:hypothetical protein